MAAALGSKRREPLIPELTFIDLIGSDTIWQVAVALPRCLTTSYCANSQSTKTGLTRAASDRLRFDMQRG